MQFLKSWLDKCCQCWCSEVLLVLTLDCFTGCWTMSNGHGPRLALHQLGFDPPPTQQITAESLSVFTDTSRYESLQQMASRQWFSHNEVMWLIEVNTTDWFPMIVVGNIIALEARGLWMPLIHIHGIAPWLALFIQLTLQNSAPFPDQRSQICSSNQDQDQDRKQTIYDDKDEARK